MYCSSVEPSVAGVPEELTIPCSLCEECSNEKKKLCSTCWKKTNLKISLEQDYIYPKTWFERIHESLFFLCALGVLVSLGNLGGYSYFLVRGVYDKYKRFAKWIKYSDVIIFTLFVAVILVLFFVGIVAEWTKEDSGSLKLIVDERLSEPESEPIVNRIKKAYNVHYGLSFELVDGDSFKSEEGRVVFGYLTRYFDIESSRMSGRFRESYEEVSGKIRLIQPGYALERWNFMLFHLNNTDDLFVTTISNENEGHLVTNSFVRSRRSNPQDILLLFTIVILFLIFTLYVIDKICTNGLLSKRYGLSIRNTRDYSFSRTITTILMYDLLHQDFFHLAMNSLGFVLLCFSFHKKEESIYRFLILLITAKVFCSLSGLLFMYILYWRQKDDQFVKYYYRNFAGIGLSGIVCAMGIANIISDGSLHPNDRSIMGTGKFLDVDGEIKEILVQEFWQLIILNLFMVSPIGNAVHIGGGLAGLLVYRYSWLAVPQKWDERIFV